ncbi:DUF6056 family protein [Microbacterium sp. PRC9]|uniref:DUF6056 family protein n=1 Tax=Microbacterium sp. PRC9 TaxID=2962591 RepID=UPI00288188A1|nr:DUF6056 family protein [Microbacterium sp. PRC9]MDT0141093.1 DUF6056 family protein [Microbacterium sp. PRC9]
MQNFVRFARRQAPLIVALAVITVAYAYLLRSVHRVPGTDDFTFAEHVEPFDSVIEWVAYRYETWSGRLLPESWLYLFTTAPLNLWRLTSLILVAAFVAALIAYARLLRPRTSPAADAAAALLAGALLFLMDAGVLRGGFTWVTGSMNYFWLVPFALIGFYPFARYAVRGRLPHPAINVVAGVAAVVAGCSAEQVGAVLVVLMVVVTIDRTIAARRTGMSLRGPLVLAGLSAATVAAFLVLMLAPGNSKRAVRDAQIWLPDFFTTPGPERFGYAVRFVTDGLVNHTGLALPMVWVLITLMLVRRRTWDGLSAAALGVSLTGLALTAIRPLESGAVFFNLHAVWKGVPDEPVPVLVLVLWLAVLLATALLPLALLRNRMGGFLTLLILGAYASLAAISLSASMYASGPRVMFVPTLFLLLAGYALFWRAFSVPERIGTAALALVLLIATTQYVFTVTTLP